MYSSSWFLFINISVFNYNCSWSRIGIKINSNYKFFLRKWSSLFYIYIKMLKLLISLFMIIWISIFLKGIELVLVLFFLRLVFFSYVDGGIIIYKLGGDLLRINLFILSVWIIILILLARFKEMLYENKYFKFYLFFILFLLYICFYRTNLIIFYFFLSLFYFPLL